MSPPRQITKEKSMEHLSTEYQFPQDGVFDVYIRSVKKKEKDNGSVVFKVQLAFTTQLKEKEDKYGHRSHQQGHKLTATPFSGQTVYTTITTYEKISSKEKRIEQELQYSYGQLKVENCRAQILTLSKLKTEYFLKKEKKHSFQYTLFDDYHKSSLSSIRLAAFQSEQEYEQAYKNAGRALNDKIKLNRQLFREPQKKKERPRWARILFSQWFPIIDGFKEIFKTDDDDI